jgi:hypothetical protein
MRLPWVEVLRKLAAVCRVSGLVGGAALGGFDCAVGGLCLALCAAARFACAIACLFRGVGVDRDSAG